MDGFFSSKAFEFAIGVIFVALHAYGRFNTPNSNRSSTTRLRFVACFGLYAATLLAIYWLVTVLAWVSPEVLEKVLALMGDVSGHDTEGSDLFRNPITTALIFTALLPNFPMLKKADQRLLQVFWDLAEIPGHAVKLAHRMYRAPYHIFPTKYDALEKEAKYFEICTDKDNFDDHASPAFAWATVASLLLEIKNWQTAHDVRYQRFIRQREVEYEALKMQFATMSARVSAYYRRLDKLDGQLQNVEQELRETLITDGRELFMKICRLMAHAVLSAETGTTARRQTIETFGFELASDFEENLSAAQLLKLICLIMASFMAVSLVRYSLEGGIDSRIIGEVIFFGFLMGANYGVSAFLGIYPKDRWRFADIEVTHRRPWLGYMTSGLIAVSASLIIISALRFTRYTFSGVGYEVSFDRLLVDLSWSYPYLAVSFAVGFGVAWVCDADWWGASSRRKRIADTLFMGAAILVASYIAYAAMHGFYPFEGTKAAAFQDKSLRGMLQYITQGTVAALLIGALVPHWFRKNRYRTPIQRVTRFIGRYSHELRIEAGKLDRGALNQSLTEVAAAMAMADGLLDDSERDVFRSSLTKMAECNMLDFSVERGMEDMMNLVDHWREGDRAEAEKAALEALRQLRGKERLSELIIQICAAIGYADGIFQIPEQYILERVVEALNRNLLNELSACGLAFIRPTHKPESLSSPAA